MNDHTYSHNNKNNLISHLMWNAISKALSNCSFAFKQYEWFYVNANRLLYLTDLNIPNIKYKNVFIVKMNIGSWQVY